MVEIDIIGVIRKIKNKRNYVDIDHDEIQTLKDWLYDKIADGGGIELVNDNLKTAVLVYDKDANEVILFDSVEDEFWVATSSKNRRFRTHLNAILEYIEALDH